MTEPSALRTEASLSTFLKISLPRYLVYKRCCSNDLQQGYSRNAGHRFGIRPWFFKGKEEFKQTKRVSGNQSAGRAGRFAQLLPRA